MEELEQARKEIEGKYRRKQKTLKKLTLAGCAVGAVLFVCGVGKAVYNDAQAIELKKGAVVSEYNQMRGISYFLRREREIPDYSNLEKIKPHLEKIFGDNPSGRKASLDNTLKIVEEEMQKLENTQAVKEYKEYNNRDKMLLYTIGSMLPLFLVGLGYIFCSCKLVDKMYKEIDATR